MDSGSDCSAGSDRDVDLPLDEGSERVVGCGLLSGIRVVRDVVRVLASYLERESRVESGSEEEKAVGVAEGCLCVQY